MKVRAKAQSGLYNALMATKRISEANSLEVEISRDVLVGISSIALEGIRGVTPVTPPVNVGEILAGVVVGPQVLGWVRPDEATFALGELGEVRTPSVADLFVAVLGEHQATPATPGAPR